MSDSVFRSGRKQSFTVLYNSMLRDHRLSLKAKGLFAIMMSLPDDWQFSISGLAAYTGYGKDIIRAALLELKEVGYLVQEQVHGDGGRFGSSVYVLQDEAPPCSGKPRSRWNRVRFSVYGKTVDGFTDLRQIQHNKIKT